MRKLKGACLLAAAFPAAVLLFLPPSRAAEGDVRGIRIGLVRTLFRDTPASLVDVLSQPLKALMQTPDGMKGGALVSGDSFDLSKKLKEHTVQLGVFHGF